MCNNIQNEEKTARLNLKGPDKSSSRHSKDACMLTSLTIRKALTKLRGQTKWSHNCCRRRGPFVLVFWCFSPLSKIVTDPTTFPSDKGDNRNWKNWKASPYFSTKHFATLGGEYLFRNQQFKLVQINLRDTFEFACTCAHTQAHAPAKA